MDASLDTGPRTAHALVYDLVTVPKRRKPVIDDAVLATISDAATDIADGHGVTVQTVRGAPDHCHVRFRAEPGTDLTTFINALKTSTSRHVRDDHPAVADAIDTGLWEPGYALATATGASVDDLVAYAEERYAWPGE